MQAAEWMPNYIKVITQILGHISKLVLESFLLVRELFTLAHLESCLNWSLYPLMKFRSPFGILLPTRSLAFKLQYCSCHGELKSIILYAFSAPWQIYLFILTFHYHIICLLFRFTLICIFSMLNIWILSFYHFYHNVLLPLISWNVTINTILINAKKRLKRKRR